MQKSKTLLRQLRKTLLITTIVTVQHRRPILNIERHLAKSSLSVTNADAKAFVVSKFWSPRSKPGKALKNMKVAASRAPVDRCCQLISLRWISYYCVMYVTGSFMNEASRLYFKICVLCNSSNLLLYYNNNSSFCCPLAEVHLTNILYYIWCRVVFEMME